VSDPIDRQALDDEIVSRLVLRELMDCFGNIDGICKGRGYSSQTAYTVMKRVINSEHVAAYFTGGDRTLIGTEPARLQLVDRLAREIELE
jgi:hypothetical protein